MQKDFVSELMPLNIEARYPECKRSLSMLLSERDCAEILNKTKQLQQWIKNKL